MPDPSLAYRRVLLSMAFFLVVHTLALVTMGAILMRGIGPAGVEASLERAHFIAENPWLWRLGWIPWQLCALSDLLVTATLWQWSHKRGGFDWAVLGFIFYFMAALPEQWVEWQMITDQVELATAVINGELFLSHFALEEQFGIILTGSFSAAMYVFMTGAWMMLARAASRVGPDGPDGQKSAEHERGGAWPGWLALTLLTVFLGACYANWRGQLPGDNAATWYQVASVANGIGFAGLLIWAVYFIGWIGEIERRQRGLAGLPLTGEPARWPERSGLASGPLTRIIAPLATWDGVRDLTRVLLRPLPFLRMVSDVRDVVYLSWLVPVERVRHLVDDRLSLDVRDGLTAVSILTYRHGNFGLRIMGPLRKLTPSPIQSNWRLYLQPEPERDSSEGIAFFANGIDNALYCVGARLMADGLPVHLFASARHERAGDTLTTELTAGAGSAPELRAVVREASAEEDGIRALPPAFAERFADWTEAIDYLVRQDRGERIHEAVGLRSVSHIRIPIAPDTVRPAVIEDFASAALGDIVAGCDGLAFVVPKVRFTALGERWLRLDR